MAEKPFICPGTDRLTAAATEAAGMPSQAEMRMSLHAIVGVGPGS